MEMKSKQYGLFLPKSKKSQVSSKNIFAEDSDDESSGHALVNNTLLKEADKAKVKRKTQLEIDKALEQDPNIYEYDDIYENMKSEKESHLASKSENDKEKKPRYISGLLKAAEKRKKEQERQQERKIQKERETEGDEFKDKEVFVTAKYKQKMLEMQEQEEKERREAKLEEMLDVKKQKDLTGFYRYMLDQTAGDNTSKESHEVDLSRVKTEKEDPEQPGEKSSSSKGIKIRSRSKSQEKTPSSSYLKGSDSRERRSKSRERRSRSRERKQKPKDRRSGSQERKQRSNERRSRSRDRRSRSRDRRSRSRDKTRKSESRSTKERQHSSHVSKDGDKDSHRKRDNRKISEPLERDKCRSRSPDSRKRGRSPVEDKPNRKSSEVDTDVNIHLEADSDRTLERNLPSEPSSKDNQRKTDKKENAAKSESDVSKYAKHTSDKDKKDARARYLARKLAKEKAQLMVSTDD